MKAINGMLKQILFPTSYIPPEVLVAQHEVIKKRLPLLYGSVLFNIICISLVMWQSSPKLLTFVIPSIFSILIIRRLRHWRLNVSNLNLSPTKISHEFQRSTKVAWALSVSVSAWVISLTYHADPVQLVCLIGFVWASAASLAIGLAYLPRASNPILAIAAIPIGFAVFHSGDLRVLILLTMYITFLVVFIHLLSQHYHSFLEAEKGKLELKKRAKENETVHQKMSYLALTDSLTDLPNRRAFFSEIEKKLDESSELGNSFAVGLIDLDGFKKINDVFGHLCGDAVLIEAGKRISEILAGTGIVCRLGGDEFGLVLTKHTDEASLLKLGATIVDAIRLPYYYGSSEALLSACCGFAIPVLNEKNTETLLDKADKALYRVKNTDSHNVEVYSDGWSNEVWENASIEQALRRAVASDSLDVHFQPIYDFANGEVHAFEALARWNDPKLGQVPPDKFITIAEQSGLIIELTNRLFEKALQCAKEWPSSICLSFNISPVQIAQPGFSLSIISVLNKFAIAPERLQLEITESVLMGRFEVARKNIKELRKTGILVALDDFGTGFASFGYLDKISVDKLKIDKNFVPSPNMASGKRKILRAIVGLGTGLGIPTIQEGIETFEQHLEAIKTGCQFGQGYYYSKPIPADKISEFLSDENKNVSKLKHASIFDEMKAS